MSNEQNSAFIKATGLWVNEVKSGKNKGKKYFAGNMGGVRIMIMKNDHKTEPNHPEYNLFFAENKPKPNPSANVNSDNYKGPDQGSAPVGQNFKEPDPPMKEDGDDDLPF